MPTANINGVQIAYRDEGTGQPILLIHAFPLRGAMWEGQIATLAREYRVIAPDLRGFGASQIVPRTSSLDQYADDLAGLLDQLGLGPERVVLGGLSMGGYIAFAVLRHAARYVHALVLADTKPQADSPEAVEGRKRLLQVVHEKGARAVADEMLPKLLGETTRREHPDVVEQVRALVLSNSTAAIVGAITALMTRPDSTPLLSTIHVPTLILVGDEDTVTPPSAAEEMHRAIAGSELVRIPGAGHLANLERPDLFDAALARFLGHRV